MKRNGFVLAETLVVIIFVLIIFTLMYNSAVPLLARYDEISLYDDLDTTYDVYQYRRLVEASDDALGVVSNHYKKVSCADFSSETNRCNSLDEYLNVTDKDTLLYINTDYLNEVANDENIREEIRDYLNYEKIDPDKCIMLMDHDGHISYMDFTEYSITYNNLDLRGVTKPENRTYYYIGTETFDINNPNRIGYIFDGWTGSNGDTPNLNVTIPQGSKGNRIYNANWTPKTYPLILNKNNATNTPTGRVIATFDSGVLEPSNITIPERIYTITYNANGGSSKGSDTAVYTFSGWYTDTNGGSKILSNSSNPTFEKNVSGYTSDNREWIRDIESEINLYARWTGGSVNLATPSRTGYTFKGWYENSSLIGGAGASYTPTSNKSFYATWQPNNYTVVYSPNGGAGGNYGQVVTYDSEWTTQGAIFGRDGYTFLGWSTSPSGGVTHAASTYQGIYQTAGDVTLYAVWGANPVIVFGTDIKDSSSCSGGYIRVRCKSPDGISSFKIDESNASIIESGTDYKVGKGYLNPDGKVKATCTSGLGVTSTKTSPTYSCSASSSCGKTPITYSGTCVCAGGSGGVSGESSYHCDRSSCSSLCSSKGKSYKSGTCSQSGGKNKTCWH